MAVIESNFERAKIEISFEGFETIIKLDNKKIEGVRGLYLNCRHDSAPSLLLDILPEKLNVNSNDKEIIVKSINLDEISANDLISELGKRIKINFN